MLLDIEKKKLQLFFDINIKKTVIVCSHERSGTHFLMNSIACNSNYTVEPYLNFDYSQLGCIINFHKTDNVSNFIKKISNLEKKGVKYGLSSIIKSHHPAYIFHKLFNNEDIIFYYVYRHPSETLMSYWKFINHWDWHEGPKENTPFNFIKSVPEGQMQRYQKKSYKSVFSRWANHVSEWLESSNKFKNIHLIQYEDLNNNYYNTMEKVLNIAGLSKEKIIRPPKENYIKTNEISLSDFELKKFINFIESSLLDYPSLKKIL